MSARKLCRYIERRFMDGPYQRGTHKEGGRWMFKNNWGKQYGVREYKTHYVLFDLNNPARPTAICKLSKGSKIKEIHD